MTARTRPVDDEPLLITIPEAAKLLGITRDHAYDLAKADALPVPVIRFSPKVWRVSLVQIRKLAETGQPVQVTA
jgi:hypothetical protein